jgi:hypothetical protein
MARSSLPKSIRKYLRHTKATIRRHATDKEEAARKISTLVAEARGESTGPSA